MRAFVVLVVLAACGHPANPRTEPRPEGNVHRAIKTTSKDAQRHFDRGLAHAYGFNFDAAKLEFSAALAADPSCAMCTWGLAYIAGENINERDKRWPGAAENAAKAMALAKDPVEHALAQALVVRYTDPTTENDAGYASVLRAVTVSHPADNDVPVLLAEAVMLTVPLGTPYWPHDVATLAVAEVQTTLERVLARAPDHIGAIHFYIHLMEDGTKRTKALPFADKLQHLAPGAGHLIHMASHLYLRVGRYADAEDANHVAIAADAALVPTLPADATYTKFAMHPKHFLWQTLLWQGERAAAHALATELAPHFQHMAMSLPKPLGLGEMIVAFTATRFGEWDDVLALEIPSTPVGALAVHFARGLAFVAKHQLDDARGEAKALTQLTMENAPDGFRERLQRVAWLAQLQVTGAIAYAAGQNDKAIETLRAATQAEDELDNPLEPPLWIFPSRQRLGAILLALGRFQAAQLTFEADLVRHPENGWSLFGLATALDAQHAPAAAAVWKRFATAWARSDVKLTSPVF